MARGFTSKYAKVLGDILAAVGFRVGIGIAVGVLVSVGAGVLEGVGGAVVGRFVGDATTDGLRVGEGIAALKESAGTSSAIRVSALTASLCESVSV